MKNPLESCGCCMILKCGFDKLTVKLWSKTDWFRMGSSEYEYDILLSMNAGYFLTSSATTDSSSKTCTIDLIKNLVSA